MSETSTRSESLMLSNGIPIPRIGLGVYKMPPGPQTQQAIENAIALGYRHIDTAAVYGNEADVGAAISASGLKRTDFFITTKLWNQDQGYETALKAFDKSRKTLGLDIIDLYLIHWPLPELRVRSWKALESLYEQGHVRSIGVSNFMVSHLEQLLDHSAVTPMVNQIELHPFLQHRDVQDFCRKHKIVVEAYSPLAKARALEHPTIVQVAQANQLEPAQVLLAWALEKDLVVIPKSVHPDRQKTNLMALSVKLSQSDMDALDGLEKGLATGWDPRTID